MQISKIRNENGEITTKTAEIQRLTRDYYKQLYANKMDNQEEMDKFLERSYFPRLNQEELENINRHITSNEIETVLKFFQETKLQDQMASQVNSIKHLEKKLTLILPKLFQKIAEEHSQIHSTKPPSP